MAGYIDIFRMHSSERLPLKLKLGLRSTSLLLEEFPLASKHLQQISDNEWMLETEVCSYDGVGRFVLGLMGDIEIIDSPEFLRYIFGQVKKMNDSLQPVSD